MENNPQNPQQDEKKKEEMKVQREGALKNLMTSEALERLKRMSIVKPQHVEAVENFILQNAQVYSQKPLVDNELIQLLSKISESKSQTVTISRRSGWKESDDEDLFEGL